MIPCKNGSTKQIKAGFYYICALSGNACPHVRWCYIENQHKMLITARDCANYSVGKSD